MLGISSVETLYFGSKSPKPLALRNSSFQQNVVFTFEMYGMS